MGHKIAPYGLASISLNQSDTVKSVLQNIAIILSTRQGSVPMYREFGLPMQFIDKPMPVARTMMIAEVQEAIDRFEPRARVTSITLAYDESAPGRLVPTVEVEINA